MARRGPEAPRIGIRTPQPLPKGPAFGGPSGSQTGLAPPYTAPPMWRPPTVSNDRPLAPAGPRHSDSMRGSRLTSGEESASSQNGAALSAGVSAKLGTTAPATGRTGAATGST